MTLYTSLGNPVNDETDPLFADKSSPLFQKICKLAEENKEKELIELQQAGIDLNEKNYNGLLATEYLAEHCGARAARLLIKLGVNPGKCQVSLARFGYLEEGEAPAENIDLKGIVEENPDKVDSFENLINYKQSEWFIIPSQQASFEAFAGEMYRLLSGIHQPKTLAVFNEGKRSHFAAFRITSEEKKYAARISQKIQNFNSFARHSLQDKYEMTIRSFLAKQGVSTLVALWILGETDLDASNTGVDKNGTVVKIDTEHSLFYSSPYKTDIQSITIFPVFLQENSTNINPLRRWFGDQKGLPESKKLINIANNPAFQREKFKYLLKFILLNPDCFKKIYQDHCGNQFDYRNVVSRLENSQSQIKSDLIKIPEFKTLLQKQSTSLLIEILREFELYNCDSLHYKIDSQKILANFNALNQDLGLDEIDVDDLQTAKKPKTANIIANTAELEAFQKQLIESINEIRDKYFPKITNNTPLSAREQVIWQLIYDLKDETTEFFNLPLTQASFNTYQRNSAKLIMRQKSTLQTHEGWKEFGARFLQIISLIGIAIGVCNLIYNGRFFVKLQTDSEQNFDKIYDQIQNFSLQT